MEVAINYRKSKRFYHNSTILLEDEHKGAFAYGKINNMSGDGMFFVTEFAFRPGTRVKFKLDNPPFKSCPNDFCGIVKWCKETGAEEDEGYPYGVGVEFC